MIGRVNVPSHYRLLYIPGTASILTIMLIISLGIYIGASKGPRSPNPFRAADFLPTLYYYSRFLVVGRTMSLPYHMT